LGDARKKKKLSRGSATTFLRSEEGRKNITCPTQVTFLGQGGKSTAVKGRMRKKSKEDSKTTQGGSIKRLYFYLGRD